MIKDLKVVELGELTRSLFLIYHNLLILLVLKIVWGS